MTDVLDPNEGEKNTGSGVPQRGDEGTDSRPVEFHPVDAPMQPEGSEYDDPNAKASDAKFDVEETNEKE